MKKIYKTIIQVEVLSEEPIKDNTDLTDIIDEMNDGSYSGITKFISSESLEGMDAINEIKKQGTATDFFQMDETGKEIEEEDL